MKIPKEIILTACTSICLFLTPAQTQAGEQEKLLIEKNHPSALGDFISGDLGVTWTSGYSGPGARGFNLVDEGWIIQPYLDLYFKLYSGDGFLSKVTFNIGMWADIQESKKGSTNTGLAHWYEYDICGGLTFTFAKDISLTITYFEITSPSGTFDNARPLYVTLAYDDTDLLGAFALHPVFQYQYQLPADGATGMQGDSSYFYFGITPSFDVTKDGPIPIKVSIPLSVGLGDRKFYNGEIFGFFSAGLQVDIALKFIPEEFGKWTWSANATYWHVGSTLEERNGRADDWMCSTSLGLKF